MQAIFNQKRFIFQNAIPVGWDSGLTRFNTSIISGLIEEIHINKVKPSLFSLRYPDENLYELQSSIEQNGLLHPLIVRPLEKGFEIVAGNRRLQACKALGFRKLPCHIMDLDDKEAYEISLIENIQRETLSPLEEAQAFKQYIEQHGWGGASDLAKRIGKSPSYVSRRIKLLSLPPELQAEILRQRKSASILSEILNANDGDLIEEISKYVFSDKLSEKDTRKLVMNIKKEFGVNIKYMSRINALDHDSNREIEEKVLKKFITVLKIAYVRLGDIISEYADTNNWRFYELVLERKHVLHELINSLIIIQKKIHHYNKQ